MAALTTSLSPSLASDYQVSNTWLTQDTTNPTGKGPVSTGPVEAVDNPANGTATVELGTSPFDWQESELTQASPDYFYQSAFPQSGPWPGIPEAYNGKEPFGTEPSDGITPIGYYKVAPGIKGLAQSKADYAGHDRHSQDVDNAGWEQYTLSGRTAIRQGWRQDYLGVDNFWPVTQPNQAMSRVARGGNQSVNGAVAQYGGLYGSGGNTAYEAPTPAQTSTQAASSGASTIPQWGF